MGVAADHSSALPLCQGRTAVYRDRMDDIALLDLAVTLADRAGAEIMAVRGRGFATRRKQDQSPVTEADHAAEALIVQALREAAPHLAVIAEEEIEAGHVHEVGREYWLVDPLDGTREFAAGRDEFTVNIGLVRDGRAVLGAVALPAYGEMFAGIVGADARDTLAWKQDAAGRRPIQVRPVPPDGLHVYASRHYSSDPKLDAFLRGRTVQAVTSIGSAVKFCRLAEGVGDLYPRFGRTMEWDTAAPQAVLEAAGGAVRRMDGAHMVGTTLGYGKPGWENPPFLCTGAEAAPG